VRRRVKAGKDSSAASKATQLKRALNTTNDLQSPVSSNGTQTASSITQFGTLYKIFEKKL